MADITVYDVAKKAKVSIATVSRVLNSSGKVNEATRKRVLAAIDSLGFVPKAEAAARARKASDASACWPPFSLTLRLWNACKAWQVRSQTLPMNWSSTV